MSDEVFALYLELDVYLHGNWHTREIWQRGCDNTAGIERTKYWNFHKYKDKASTTCPWHTRRHTEGAAPPKWKSNKHGVKMLANVKTKTIISNMSSKSLHPIDLSQCQIVNPSITAPRIRALVTDSHLLGWLRCQRRLRLNYDGHVTIFGKTLLLLAFSHTPFSWGSVALSTDKLRDVSFVIWLVWWAATMRLGKFWGYTLSFVEATNFVKP